MPHLQICVQILQGALPGLESAKRRMHQQGWLLDRRPERAGIVVVEANGWSWQGCASTDLSVRNPRLSHSLVMSSSTMALIQPGSVGITLYLRSSEEDKSKERSGTIAVETNRTPCLGLPVA